MFNHVRCRECKTCYNGRSGKSNNTAITLYMVIPLVLGVSVCCCIGIFSVIGNLPEFAAKPPAPRKNGPRVVQRPIDQGPPANERPKKRDRFTFIEEALQKGLDKNSDIVGQAGGAMFREVHADGAMVVAFRIGVKSVGGDDEAIIALQPIYMTRFGEVEGNWIGKRPMQPLPFQAPPNYVVKSIQIRTSTRIEALSITFVKYNDSGLERNDLHTSIWRGNKNAGQPATINSDDRVVIGVCGRLNADGEPCALGLITVPVK